MERARMGLSRALAKIGVQVIDKTWPDRHCTDFAMILAGTRIEIGATKRYGAVGKMLEFWRAPPVEPGAKRMYVEEARHMRNEETAAILRERLDRSDLADVPLYVRVLKDGRVNMEPIERHIHWVEGQYMHPARVFGHARELHDRKFTFVGPDGKVRWEHLDLLGDPALRNALSACLAGKRELSTVRVSYLPSDRPAGPPAFLALAPE